MNTSVSPDQPWSSSIKFCIAVNAYWTHIINFDRGCKNIPAYCEHVSLIGVDDVDEFAEAVTIQELDCELIFLSSLV